MGVMNMSDWVETVAGTEVPHVETHSRDKGTWLTEYTEEEAEKEFPNIAKHNTPTDLISRTDTVKEFIKLFGCIQDVSDINEWADICQTTICEVPSAKPPSTESEWIPVSEGLPDTDVPVLVSDGVYVWEDELQEDYEDGKTMYWWDSQCSFDFNDTAWMPRPKPYRKGDEA